MASLPGMDASVGVLQAIQAELAAMAAANQAAAVAVVPPGNEGASALAMGKQQANAAEFGVNFGLGIEQLMELSATIQQASVATVIADAGSAKVF